MAFFVVDVQDKNLEAKLMFTCKTLFVKDLRGCVVHNLCDCMR